AQHARVNKLFDLLDFCVHPIKIGVKAKPGVQPENITMLFNGFHYLSTFTDGPGHRLFTPDVFSMSGSIHTHDAMPVGRCCNVHDIYFRKLDELSVIGKGFYAGILKGVHGYFDVSLVHVTDCNRFSAGILKMAPTHAAYTDDPFGEVVTWRQEAFAQHMPWHNRNAP